MSISAGLQTELDCFLDSISVGIVQWNEEGAILFVNVAAESILGIRRDQLPGKRFTDTGYKIIHEDESAFSSNDFPPMIALRTGQPQRNKIMGIINPSGQLTWISLNADPLFAPGKKTPESVIATFTDITEMKRSQQILSENEARFRGIFDSAYQFIGLLSPDGRILEANKTALQFANLTAADVKGKYFWESYSGFLPESVSGRLREDIRKASEGKLVRYSTPLAAPDGALHWIDFSLKPLFDEKKKVVMLIAEGRDVTKRVELQRKYQEEQLEKQKEILRAALDAQEKERNELGKELHDNINQMLASVKLLIESYQRNNDIKNVMLSKGRSMVEECIEEIRRLTGSLVSPKLQKMGLAEAVKTTIETLLTVQVFGVDLLLDEELILRLTENQSLSVYRIIQEQLNNILKHSEARQIKISLAEKDQMVRLEIADDGKGFDPQMRNRGIGLLNMENRVRLLNGEFDVVSAPGKGCKIIAAFPVH